LLGEIQNTNLWVNHLHHSGHRFLSPTIGTVPQQQDGNSCGAYAVESGLLFLQGLQDWPPAFKPTSGEVDLRQYQLQLAASIINSSAGDGPVRPFCHSPAFQPSISKPQTQAPVSTPVSPSSSTPANQKEFDVQLNEPPLVSLHTLVVPSHMGHASVTAQDSAQPTNMLPSQLCKPGMQSDLPTSQLQGMDMSGEESCTHETSQNSQKERKPSEPSFTEKINSAWLQVGLDVRHAEIDTSKTKAHLMALTVIQDVLRRLVVLQEARNTAYRKTASAFFQSSERLKWINEESIIIVSQCWEMKMYLKYLMTGAPVDSASKSSMQ
ncbi:hypothetical protein HDU78_011068, partial [Chytriomyces hyalinus]